MNLFFFEKNLQVWFVLLLLIEKQFDWFKNSWNSGFTVSELVVGSGEQNR